MSAIITPTTHKKAPKEKPDQKYAPTLLLPKTAFPLRADAAVREHLFCQRCTTDLYAWQRENNEGDLFVLHDGPPYANGHLHLGHALNKVLKDFVNRQHVMRGFKVDYRPGWDCHGLPIELKALAELKVSDRSSLSPTQVRAVAQATAQSTVEAQRAEFLAYGVMGDWENGYRTMDRDFETRQLNVFYEMMNKGLIYRANKPVYWSPSSKTALAESELEYKEDHKSRSAWVAFLVDHPSQGLARLLPDSVTLHAVVWTTTPWTLPANRSVAVHPKMTYRLFRPSATNDPSKVYLAVAEQLDEMKKRFAPKDSTEPATLELFGEISGQDLVGSRYQHPLTTESMPFIAADYVTSDSGSGLVHTAPGHGMDDYKTCYPLGIEAFCPVDNVGDFTAEAGPELEGLNVQTKGTDKVLQLLAIRGTLIQEHVYVHKYPYDWRTKKPVILRATSQWFANVGTIKEDALKAIESVRIIPEGARRRLEGFVHSRSEWCISRQRSWGVPIPVMYDNETDEPLLTKSSVHHVIDIVREHGADAWWSMTTEELLAPEYRNNGKIYRRGFDTMDVWFDSGTSWTMIQEKMPRPHLPFVADVYCEGSDQHRGWFQSSLLTSVALTGKAPYGTLITHGFLLDAKGFKQSKSLGNTVDPAVIINGGKNLQKDPAYGTDLLRLWAASSEYTKDIAIGKTILTQVAESMRKFRTTARFILGNLNGFKEAEAVAYEELSRLDRFMLSETYQFCKNVNAAYDEYMFNKVFGQLQYFTSTTLSSFYLDVIKDTLYSEAENSPKRRAVQTVLFHVLNALNKSIAPLAPHFAEEVYENYRDCFMSSQPSVFRTGWLEISESWNDAALREEFQILKQLRVEANQLLEQARAAKVIGPSLEATVEFQLPTETETPVEEQEILSGVVKKYADDFAKLFITSEVFVTSDDLSMDVASAAGKNVFVREVCMPKVGSCRLVVRRATLHKCPRCWAFTSKEQDVLCNRCGPVVASLHL
ncbi:isoleucyl-tRNA synthetase [Gamsiella multidivaricata]|uniref:isoleucyl-tRNA synthetase n=1 Tax=Gamsiella multidivaricata TaxID=101098 RepID=UPI00221E4AF4|nr:isoleucyl-tRNA synthetase [Gamsiella multidivaricata]KAI7826957.1 isoleucyl-tRNA synthetase [Gamsiella multidivaricata]